MSGWGNDEGKSPMIELHDWLLSILFLGIAYTECASTLCQILFQMWSKSWHNVLMNASKWSSLLLPFCQIRFPSSVFSQPFTEHVKHANLPHQSFVTENINRAVYEGTKSWPVSLFLLGSEKLLLSNLTQTMQFLLMHVQSAYRLKISFWAGS